MYIVLCRNNGIGSLLLRALMWSRWSHSAIYDKELEVVYDSTMWHGGVRCWLASEFFKHYPRHELREMGVRDLPGLRAWLQTQLGKPYDWTALLAMPFRGNWQRDDAWFCSEFSETARTLFGEPRFRTKAFRITPHHQDIVL